MTTDDDATLESLPRTQFHAFVPLALDELICERCGGPPQAHPSPAWIAEHPEDVR
jgi:hypothetical protein